MTDPLADLAVRLAARGPGVCVGWDASGAVGNAQFMRRMWAWHALLEGQSGVNFALYLDDSIEFGAALLGAWQAGKTIWLTADTLDASCTALRACVDGFLGEFPQACAPMLAALDAGACGGTRGTPGTPGTLGIPGTPRTPLLLAPDFAALVVHTSGSTGAAQAIPKRLAQLGHEVAALEAQFGALAGDAAIVATVSHQHIYGLLFKVLWPLAAGRPICAFSVNFPEALAALLAERSSVLVASPAHLKRLPAELGWSGARAQLRAVFSSGGPLALEVAQATGKLLGQVPVEVYGSSETGGIAWRQRLAGSDESWLAFPGVDWRLAPHDNLLEVRSPNLADAGWLRLADRAMASTALHGDSGPGDLRRGDARPGDTWPGDARPSDARPGDVRRFLLLGRSDRIVKIEEKRISLEAIEAVLAACDLVYEARVLPCAPVPGERQKLAAFVVLSGAGRAVLAAAGKLALNRRLRTALGGAVEAVALPRRWRYLEQMPVNAQGKTTQAALLALLGSGARPRLPHLQLLQRIAECVVLELNAPANLLYFDGHFENAPVLAGVVQLDWAIAFGRQYFALPPQFLGVHALKFQHVIRPDQTVRLELLHDVAKGSLNFRYLSDSGQHASGRVLFGAAPISPTGNHVR